MNLTFEYIEDLKTLSQEDYDILCKIIYQWYGIYHHPLDPPSLDVVNHDLNLPADPFGRLVSAIARLEEKIVAISRIFINSQTENKHRAFIRVITKTEYQNQGIGKALFKFTIQCLPDVITTITTNTRNDDYNDGKLTWLDNVLIKLGGKMAILDRKSGANLKEFECETVKEIAKSHRERIQKEGYSLLFIDNYDFPHDFDMADYLKSLEQIWNDMPRDEMDANDSEMSAEIYSQLITRLRVEYDKSWLIVCLKNNKTVGVTLTFFDKFTPSLAIQDDTGVIREHRGHGLGIALKYQMLEKLLCDPFAKQTTYWITHNTHSNSHMIRINNELKYKEMATFVLYEFKKEELLKKLS